MHRLKIGDLRPLTVAEFRAKQAPQEPKGLRFRTKVQLGAGGIFGIAGIFWAVTALYPAKYPDRLPSVTAAIPANLSPAARDTFNRDGKPVREISINQTQTAAAGG